MILYFGDVLYISSPNPYVISRLWDTVKKSVMKYTADDYSLGFIALLLASALWGASYIIIKYLLVYIDPIPQTFVRFLSASVILVAFTLNRKYNQHISKKTIIKAFFLSIFGIGFMQLLLVYGMITTKASVSSFLFEASAPPFIILFTLIFFFEEFRKYPFKKLLIGCSFCIGGLLTLINPINHLDFGIILILLASFCWAFYVIVSKSIMDEINDPILLGTIVFSISSFFLFPIFAYKYDVFSLFRAPIEIIILLIVSGILNIAIPHLLLYYGIRKTGTIMTGFIQALIPFFSLIFAYIFLGETLSVIKVTGGICACVGIIVLKKSVLKKSPM